MKTCSTARKTALLELELVALSLHPILLKVSDFVLNSVLWFTQNSKRGWRNELEATSSTHWNLPQLLDLLGNSLPHFTPRPSPGSHGINLFAQNLGPHKAIMRRPYVFPSKLLTGPVESAEFWPILYHFGFECLP